VRECRLFCTCGTRRQFTQDFRIGDWICPDCGNHVFASKDVCTWSRCPSLLPQRRRPKRS
jgi:hypothetical protein